ncbi:hypothetical protein D9758_017883 [Tetrapyrgos nigripes]|uniref:Uncharacterized protein n=1 Tax=Tetrapyrgos nigripes TaxID=182062 RepID=A0A8H5F1L1_9AGAR|nr:hypothetical protein D9758_017883 [Tetrapyrgos nigripes]
MSDAATSQRAERKLFPPTLACDCPPPVRGAASDKGRIPKYQFGWLVNSFTLLRCRDPNGFYTDIGDLESEALIPEWWQKYGSSLSRTYRPRFHHRTDCQVFICLGSNKDQHSIDTVLKLDQNVLVHTYSDFLNLPLPEPQWYRLPIPYDAAAVVEALKRVPV